MRAKYGLRADRAEFYAKKKWDSLGTMEKSHYWREATKDQKR